MVQFRNFKKWNNYWNGYNANFGIKQNNMKKRLEIITLVLITAVVVTSCSTGRVPFTQQLRDQYKLNVEELKSIQFYTSNNLVLRRAETESKKETSGGELTISKDRVLEEIVIKAGTPCVIKDVVDGSRVTVTFEDGGNKYLVFGSIRNRDGYYTLQALDWTQGKGKVNYGEQLYITSEGSRDIFLVLKMKSLNQFKVDQKVIKGKTVN